MADVNCHSEMRGFHADRVTLAQAQQDDMRERRDAGRTRLSNGLELQGAAKPAFIHSQGSYAMRTMVQDSENDYDIDDGAYFHEIDLINSSGRSLAPAEARERICEALKWDGRLSRKAETKRNCVRQQYPAGYHIDIPVYRIVPDTTQDSNQRYELASGDDWIKSDARSVTKWFNDLVGTLNYAERDGSQMRRVVKLTKALSRSRDEWKPHTASGICLTKLVVDHFVAMDEREDLSVRGTWREILRALDISTRIEHPVDPEATLADHGNPEVEFFRDCLQSALNTLSNLDALDCDKQHARSIWDEVFHTEYFSTRPDPNGSGGKGPAVHQTSSDTARRDDAGERFG